MYHGEPVRPSGQTGEPDARTRKELPSGKGHPNSRAVGVASNSSAHFRFWGDDMFCVAVSSLQETYPLFA
jgi:hypothetical protein